MFNSAGFVASPTTSRFAQGLPQAFVPPCTTLEVVPHRIQVRTRDEVFRKQRITLRSDTPPRPGEPPLRRCVYPTLPITAMLRFAAHIQPASIPANLLSHSSAASERIDRVAEIPSAPPFADVAYPNK